jgi:hypothetical protein
MLWEVRWPMPVVVIHDLWLYLLVATGSFILLFVICQYVLLGIVSDFWIRRVHKKKLPDNDLSPAEYPLAGKILLVLSLLVYSAAAFFGQFGYAFGWFAIVAGVDIFVSRFNVYETDKKGKEAPVAPSTQAEFVQIDLIFDTLMAALAVGGTLLFLQTVTLT